MKKSSENKENIRRRIIGLGEDSIHKSYYPQLQNHISELEKKNNELSEAMRELEATQSSLISSEMKYRTLFNNSTDAIFILDSDFKVSDCNNQATKIYGIPSKEEIIGKKAKNLSPEFQPNGQKSSSQSRTKLKEALSGKSQIFDWVFKNRKGKNIFCLVSLNAFNVAGEKFIQSIVRDITQMKKLEHELGLATIRTEENERLRFAKELHDGIGPILSTIKLYMQWLEETTDENHKKLIIEKANDNIVEAIQALKEVSNNLSPHILVNYGLIEALNQFIEKIIHTGKIDIDFQHNLKERLDEDIEVMFFRVATELLNNTLKYADASKVKINLNKNEQFFQFEYADNGIGFNLEDVLNSKKKGLGFHNIKNRVKNLGGKVTFQAQPKKGFKVSIIIDEQTFFNGSK